MNTPASPFFVVDEFERQVAQFAGAKHAVAVNSGTSALLLSLLFCREHSRFPVSQVTLPARTFISVPMMCLHADYEVQFDDFQWSGTYELAPLPIVDGALRFRRGMYEGGLHCLSFHYRKIVPIGEGGMVLTDDPEAARWLRAARYCGREGPDFAVENVTTLGLLVYMSVDKAARGLAYMQWAQDDAPDQVVEYPDLRNVPLFKRGRNVAYG